MNSEASILASDDGKPDNMLNEEDSDSSPPERPTTLSVDSTHDSNEDPPCVESLDAEETPIRRSVSNVGQTGKFRLRDISPSGIRERRKGRRLRKNSNQESKPASSPRKNRSTTSWLPASFQQMFPSYKSKVGDFKRLFKHIPETERLVTDYSCALQRDILVHGRLYVSQNWLCFYANIFGWETLVTITIKHVTSMTKEKTALVIPNAIQVWTESEKYFFTSFVSRDSTFRSLFRVWQNVLSDEPVSVPTLMKQVGKYLDVDSEELETSSRCSNDELPSDFDDIVVDENNDYESLVDSEDPHSNDSPKESTRSVENIDKPAAETARNGLIDLPNIAVSPASPGPTEEISTNVTGSAAPKTVSNGTVPRSSPKAPATSETRRRFPFPFKKELSPLTRRKPQPQLKSRRSLDSINDTKNRDSLMEDGSVSEEDDDAAAPVLCPCESHFALECINEEYVTDVDAMYEYLFTDCDFYRSMRAARKDFNLDIEPWTEENNEKRRSVKYTINLNLTLGPKTSKIEEKQELKISEPGQFYVVESSVINGGIPYSESFLIVQRYCLTKVNAYMCRLRVTATVKYIRPVWGFVKNIITKNSTEGLSSFFAFLKVFLRTAEKESMIGTRLDVGKLPSATRSRLENTESNSDEEIEDNTAAAPTSKVDRISTLARRIWRQNNYFVNFLTFLLILLVVLNVYFGYRVISLERSTKSWESLGLPSLPSDWPTDIEEFRSLLYKQQYVQSLQLKRWQQVLSTSMQFLQQVQDSLKELQQEVEKPLNE